MKKIWIVSLLLLGCFAARAQAPAPLKGRIAVSVPRVDMRLSYAEYDKAFSAATMRPVRRRSPASSSFRASSSKSSACFRTGIRSTGA